MVAKNDKAHKSLSEQLKHSVTRRYVALVHGVIPHVHGKVNAPIGRDVNDRQNAVTKNNSKEAITNFTVLERYDDMSLIECRLETGRTHQIRCICLMLVIQFMEILSMERKKMIKVMDNSYMLKN